MSGIFGGGGGGQNTVEPVAAGLRVQTSAYGLALPIVYGRTRVTGNLIWFGDFTPIPHTATQQSGGKGGGGVSSSNTSYTYSTSFALGLCEGTITGPTNTVPGYFTIHVFHRNISPNSMVLANLSARRSEFRLSRC